jgi:glycosyltransferase involved in cell wall biosynthesis
MSRLDVLIPSIGRDSILQSINSICGDDISIKVFLSGVDRFDYIPKVNSYGVPVTIVGVDSVIKSAGYAKNYLLDHVSSKYFLMLDDDDRILPGISLGYIMDELDETGSDWSCLNWVNDPIDENILFKQYLESRDSIGLRFRPVSSYRDYLMSIYSFSDYKGINYPDKLYPNNSMIVRSSIMTLGCDKFMDVPYGDDAIFINNVCIEHKGLNVLGYSVVAGYHSDETVSKRFVSPELSRDVILRFAEKINNCDKSDQFNCWNKALRNFKELILFHNRKFKSK